MTIDYIRLLKTTVDYIRLQEVCDRAAQKIYLLYRLCQNFHLLHFITCPVQHCCRLLQLPQVLLMTGRRLGQGDCDLKQ